MTEPRLLSREELQAARERLSSRMTRGVGAVWDDADVEALLAHIAALEQERDAERTRADQAIDDWDAARKQWETDVAAWVVLRDEWREKAERMEQHVSELERSLEHARQSESVCRKRVEAAVDALADVLPGEVGRMDLLARIRALKGELARLKPSGQVEDAELWCDACAGLRPHRWKPSPDAGPFWRCSECGRPFRADSDPAETVAVVRMLTTLAAKERARVAALPASAHVAPAGQAAEDDAETVREFIVAQEEPSDFALNALRRIAAKAQGYEAAVAENIEMRRLLATRVEASRLDEANAELGKACADRDAATAANAAKEVAMYGALAALSQPATLPADVRAAREFLTGALRPHPGAALLEEHRKALVQARNEGLEKAKTGVMRAIQSSSEPPSFMSICMAIDALREPEQ